MSSRFAKGPGHLHSTASSPTLAKWWNASNTYSLNPSLFKQEIE